MTDNVLTVDETIAQLDAQMHRALEAIGNDYERMATERLEARALAKKYHDAFERMARSIVSNGHTETDSPEGIKQLAAIRAAFL
jgi:hypothetical protein